MYNVGRFSRPFTDTKSANFRYLVKVSYVFHQPPCYEMAVIKCDCPAETKKAFKDLAKKKGETESALLRKAVKMYVADQKPKLP